MLNMNLNAIINGWAVKNVMIASLLNYLLIAYVQGSIPAFEPYLLGFVIMALVAGVLQDRVKRPSLIAAGGIGIISYGVYSLLLTLTMLDTGTFLIADEALMAVSFGAMVAGVYYLMGLFKE